MTETKPKISPTVAAFLGRCDAYCQMTGRTDVWLSKRLLDDTKGLSRLREGKDIFVTRIERAGEALTVLIDEAWGKLATETTRRAAAKKVWKDAGFDPPAET